MNELPMGWVNVPIGEICTLYNGRAFKPREWSQSGLPIIRIQNLNNPNATFNYFDGELNDRHLIEPGTLLFAWSGTPGTSFGAHEWRGEKAALNQHIFKITFDEGSINKSFFKYAINQKLTELIGNAQGGVGLRHVTKSTFTSTKIVLPSLNEQIRIANKLDSLLAKVETARNRLEKIPVLLKRFRQSVLAAATSGELTRDSINEPISWLPKKLGDLIEKGPQNGLYKHSNLYGQGTKIIRIDGFYDGELLAWDSFKRVEISKEELASWKLYVNDILINRVNSIEYLGKCGLVRSLPEDTVFESNIMRFSLNSLVIPEYLKIFLTSPIGIKRLRANAKHAVNQASINQTDVKNCEIELPCLEEQAEIVRRVESLFAQADKVEAQYKAAKTRLDKLTQSILAKAFRGELVPQDPNDEPASELLKRIQAERGQQAKAKPKRARKVAQ